MKAENIQAQKGRTAAVIFVVGKSEYLKLAWDFLIARISGAKIAACKALYMHKRNGKTHIRMEE